MRLAIAQTGTHTGTPGTPGGGLSVGLHLNAFIPREVPCDGLLGLEWGAARAMGASLRGCTTQLERGAHAGRTALYLPLVNEATNALGRVHSRLGGGDWAGAAFGGGRAAYLTDQRGFSAHRAASSRIQSAIDFDALTGEARGGGTHRTSGTVEVYPGSEAAPRRANSTISGQWTGPMRLPAPPGRLRWRLALGAEGSDPFVWLGDWGGPIRYQGRFDIEVGLDGDNRPAFVRAGFHGRVADFPAYEAYLAVGGRSVAIFRLPPPPGKGASHLADLRLALRRAAAAGHRRLVGGRPPHWARVAAEPSPRRPVSGGATVILAGTGM